MKLYAGLGRRGRIILWFASVALFFLLLALLIYGIFALVVSPDREGGTLTYKAGVGARRDPSRVVSRSDYQPDGIYYVDFEGIAKGCGFSVSGDEKSRRYLIENKDGRIDSVTFYEGSRQIMVNGTHYMLSGAVHRLGTALLVPAEFITVCMDGVTVETKPSSIRVIYDPDAVSLRPDLRPIDPVEP